MWEKKLYIRQPFPDNHVDSSFLSEMKKNINIKIYTFKELFLGACYVHQHWSSVFMFIVLFAQVYMGTVSIATLHMLNNMLLGGIYIFWMSYLKMSQLNQKTKYERKQVAKAAILLIMTLLGLTPVLKTLTEDISTDTICILAGLLFCMNLAFHNYGEELEGKPNAIAINASVFGSVMMVSRLNNRGQVFGLLSIAVVWFSLFPIARAFISSIYYPRCHLLLSFIISLLTLFGLYSIQEYLGYTYFLLSFILIIICPAWYIKLQKYKNNIHGPWDEANISK